MNNSDFQVYLEYLDKLAAGSAEEGLTQSNQVAIYRAQGSHKALTTLTREARTSHDPKPRPAPRRIV